MNLRYSGYDINELEIWAITEKNPASLKQV